MNTDIVAETVVRAPTERVFEAIASEAGWDGWFTDGTLIEPNVGGRVHLVWTAVGPDRSYAEDEGHVVKYEPPSVFAFTWGKPESVVTIELSPHQEGTLVSLIERGIPDDHDGHARFASCSVGWGEALTLMKFWVEHRVTYR